MRGFPYQVLRSYLSGRQLQSGRLGHLAYSRTVPSLTIINSRFQNFQLNVQCHLSVYGFLDNCLFIPIIL